MNMRIFPGSLHGRVEAMISSKSHAHRVMLCAALANAPTRILGNAASKDVRATARCLKALGASVDFETNAMQISPIGAPSNAKSALDCGESGSTLRFMLPIVGALGLHAAFWGQGKLAARPLSPLYEALAAHGMRLSPQGKFPLECEGRLLAGRYEIAGNVSSQFVSGLLFALPLLEGDSELYVSGKLESAPYVALTLRVLSDFGICVSHKEGYIVPGGQIYRSPGRIEIEADWSNAAFWLAAGALGGDVSCTLPGDSAQGDRAVAALLRRFGAGIARPNAQSGEAGKIDFQASRPAALTGIAFDASDIPDLVPILAVVAGAATGDTVISGVGRLRLKESDRIESVIALLRALGVCAEEEKGTLTIHGRGALSGGVVDSFNDHRIVMAAAIAGSVARAPVTILRSEACAKSYPGFFEQFAALGGRAEEAYDAVNIWSEH